MKSYVSLAVRAARAAGKIIKEDFGTRSPVDFKGRINPVTETDLKAERVITSLVRAECPSHNILAEEEKHGRLSSSYLWIIDPLDGTVNFTHGYPFISVSIALQHREELILGVVFDPIHNELFVGEKGKGAMLNGTPVHVSNETSLEKSLLCTGFPYSIREDPSDNFENFRKFCLSAQGVRRAGSAALDLCYVAMGRLEGFWERTLKPWDTAAAALILREAGGLLTDYSGNDYNPFLEELVATNGRIHEDMLRIIHLR
jgi:myo-inositol-1(or 4)-monophosphatase